MQTTVLLGDSLTQGGGQPTGKLAEKIDQAFGDLDGFKDAFTQAALNRFGSGWAWLIQTSSGNSQ